MTVKEKVDKVSYLLNVLAVGHRKGVPFRVVVLGSDEQRNVVSETGKRGEPK